jgi:hypothetical protein
MAIKRLIDEKTLESNKGALKLREDIKSAIDKIADACGLSDDERRALKIRLTKKEV